MLRVFSGQYTTYCIVRVWFVTECIPDWIFAAYFVLLWSLSFDIDWRGSLGRVLHLFSRKKTKGWPLQNSVFNSIVGYKSFLSCSGYKWVLIRAESPSALELLGDILQTYRSFFTLVNYCYVTEERMNFVLPLVIWQFAERFFCGHETHFRELLLNNPYFPC